MINIDLNYCLDVLKQAKAPIEEIRLIEMFYKENEWSLLTSEQKQMKRKTALEYFRRLSQDNNNFKNEEDLINLYDLGDKILKKNIPNLNSELLLRLKVFITIQQELINEYPLNQIKRIRCVDFNLFKNIIDEVKSNHIYMYSYLELQLYLELLKINWYTIKS